MLAPDELEAAPCCEAQEAAVGALFSEALRLTEEQVRGEPV